MELRTAGRRHQITVPLYLIPNPRPLSHLPDPLHPKLPLAQPRLRQIEARLHPQQGIGSDAEGLLEPQRHRSAESCVAVQQHAHVLAADPDMRGHFGHGHAEVFEIVALQPGAGMDERKRGLPTAATRPYRATSVRVSSSTA